MRVLVTGGYGFFGAWIVRELLAEGHQPVLFDLEHNPRRLEIVLSGEQISSLPFVQGDVCTHDAVLNACKDQKIDGIIHLAGLQVPTCRARPLDGARVNVTGTLEVLEAARILGESISRVVLASSAAVFGPPGIYPAGPLSEDVRNVPGTHYGWFKLCNEGNARVYGTDHGVKTVALRPWTVYGPGRDVGMTSEPTKAVKCLALGRPYKISYGGIQDLQYAQDVARVFVRCLTGPWKGPNAYNLRGAVVDIAEFHRVLCTVDPRAAELISHGTSQLQIAPDLCDAALQRDYGPLPPTPLADGLAATLKIFRDLLANGQLDTSDLG